MFRRRGVEELGRVRNPSKTARVGSDPTCVQARCAQWMMRAFFSGSDLGPSRVSVRRMSLSCLLYQTLKCPTVLQHYTGSPSTPPRVARLCQFREASLVSQKFLQHLRLLSCVDRSTRPLHHTFCSNSSCHSFPSCQLPSELVSTSSDLNL